jgi:hypothetical protein
VLFDSELLGSSSCLHADRIGAGEDGSECADDGERGESGEGEGEETHDAVAECIKTRPPGRAMVGVCIKRLVVGRELLQRLGAGALGCSG